MHLQIKLFPLCSWLKTWRSKIMSSQKPLICIRPEDVYGTLKVIKKIWVLCSQLHAMDYDFCCPKSKCNISYIIEDFSFENVRSFQILMETSCSCNVCKKSILILNNDVKILKRWTRQRHLQRKDEMLYVLFSLSKVLHVTFLCACGFQTCLLAWPHFFFCKQLSLVVNEKGQWTMKTAIFFFAFWSL